MIEPSHTQWNYMSDGQIHAPCSQEDIFTHLGHAACNVGFILWALKRNKVTRLDIQRAAVIALDEKREDMEALEKEQHQRDMQAQNKASLLQCQGPMLSMNSSNRR